MGEEEELGLARLGLTHPEGSRAVEVGSEAWRGKRGVQVRKVGLEDPLGATPRQRWRPSLRGSVLSAAHPWGLRPGRAPQVPSRSSVQLPAASP